MRLVVSSLHLVAAFLGYLIVALISTWSLMSSPGTIGLARDWTTPAYPDQYYLLALKDFYSYYDWAGGDQVRLPTSYLISAIWGALSVLGLAGEAISKGTVLFSTVLSGLSAYYLSRSLGTRGWPAFVSGLFYMSTYNIVGRFWQGHLIWLVSYAIAPLALAAFRRTFIKVEGRSTLRLRSLIFAGLIYAFSWTQSHFVAMMFVMMLSYVIFMIPAEIKTKMKSFLILNAIAVLVHLPWISAIAVEMAEGSPLLAQVTTNFSEAGVNGLKSTFLDNLRLLGYQFPRQLDPLPFGLSLSIAIVAFSSLLWRRDRSTLYFSSIAVSALLVSSRDSILGSSVTWAILHLPGLILFADPFHLVFLISLSYAILIGLATHDVGERWFNFLRKHVSAFHIEAAGRRATQLVASLMLIIIIFSNMPFFQALGNVVQTYDLGKDNERTFEYLVSQPGNFRVAWLPLGSQGRSNYSAQAPVRDLLMLLSPKPAIDADWSPWHPYFAFLARTFDFQRTKYLAKLLGESAAVKYIIARNDFFSHYQYEFGGIRDQRLLLKEQKGPILEQKFGDKQIYSNPYYAPYVRVGKAILVAGDLSSLISLSYYFEELKNESLPLLFFISQLTSKDLAIFDKATTIVLQNDNLNDLLFAFVPDEFKFDAGLLARTNFDPHRGWTYVGLWWWGVPWYYLTQVEPVAITFTSSSLSTSFRTQEQNVGQHNVWAKILVGPQGSSLSFLVDDKPLGQVKTLIGPRQLAVQEGEWKWVSLGAVYLDGGEHILTVKSADGKNAVGRIVIAPSIVLDEAIDTMQEKMKDKDVIGIVDAERAIDDQLAYYSNWATNAAGGIALRMVFPKSFEATLHPPISGNYEIKVRTTSPESIDSVGISGPLVEDFENVSSSQNTFRSLVGWWKMDGGSGNSAGDSSGNQNAGTVRASWVTGKFGTALRFNGNDSYVSIPDSVSLSKLKTTFTIEMWFNAITFDEDHRLIDKLNSGTYPGWDVRIGPSNTVIFRMLNSAGEGTDLFSGTLSTSTWHHLVGTYDGAVYALYIDGVPVQSIPLRGSISNKAPMTIGGYQTGTPGFSFNGFIRNVKLYDRALSPDEIASEYGGRAPSINGWLSSSGKVLRSSKIVNSGNYSLMWTLEINKTSGLTHVLTKAFPGGIDLSKSDGVVFFLYVETPSPIKTSEINFGLVTSTGENRAWSFYVNNNEPNFVSTNISDFKSRGNITRVQFSVGDEWGTYVDKQQLVLIFDTLVSLEAIENKPFQWYTLGNRFLTSGYNRLNFTVGTAGPAVDMFVYELRGTLIGSTQTADAPKTTYSFVNPTKHLITVNASEPLFLILDTNYSPFWKASIDGVPLEHFKGNFFANGYYIDRIGTYTVSLEFDLQPLYGATMLLAYLTIALSALYVALPPKLLKKVRALV